jgi:DNA polymerase III subunit epsilon
LEEIKFIAVDVETTGLNPWRGHRVIEIAAVKIQEDCMGDSFHSLIDCGRSVPKKVQEINGICNEMLCGQPGPEIVFRQFLDFIGGSVLIAHNASFDRLFIRAELGRLGWRFSNPFQCTLKLSRKKLSRLPDHRLETVFRHLFPGEIEGVLVHRALGDAWMAGLVWVAMGGGR